MDISALKRDSKAAEAGEWVSDIPGLEDARLRVRGLASPTVVALRSRKERKVSREGRERDGSLKPEVAMRILGEVLHEAVLLEWDGFTDGGNPLPYDADLAKEWLTNPDYMAFADAVTWAASVVDKGRADYQADAEGNSKRSSHAASLATT
ncbi:hypothetical protein [Aquamicrobium sp. LC103]|uniref:hypothetical protein n=1 Tax=Aquamicrobium sp. LC103 TaxID=1120658 RepID=UPI00063E9E5C|nr:hypothetical protein [Aquamicrobium sp. LC103]TKT79970.1 hypothetical protein XW59_006300 [Aquamicrobium sp. LC103]